MKYSVCAIICAAGKGERAGFVQNKLLVPFQGSTALEKTLSAFDFPLIDEILVSSSSADFRQISDICERFTTARAVIGGETRMHSVYNALKETNCDIVLVHDGARPYVTREIIEKCIRSVQAQGSGVCSVPCTDTVAVVKENKIISVPARSTLRQIQTPQGFFTENLRTAYERAFETERLDFTDDSSIFAAFCGAPRLCEGDLKNVKLTYASDFSSGCARCGFGIDTHAFGKAQTYITLGGVKIPSESGLIAHSDGDVLIHALMDALLSAAGKKDIGHYFPDTDERFKDASSVEMLRQVVALLKADGYQLQNASIAIQAEKPRLAKYIDDMKNVLSGVLGVDATAVGISAGTNEGLGYVGEGKGITVNAYVLITK